MRILNIEDEAVKHSNICKILKKYGIAEIDWAKNLEDAIQMVKEHSTEYGLLITDMFYPLESGGEAVQSGEIFITKMKEMEIEVPIILCSSVRYQIPDILGTVYYSQNSDWERQLGNLVQKCRG